MTWPTVKLGEVCEFKYGKSLAAGHRDGGQFPVYGSNGIVGAHSKPLTSGPTIVIGRKGSFGEVAYSPGSCWPIDTTYYIDGSSTAADLKWLSYRLGSLGLTSLNRAAAVPGLNREDAYRQELLLPPLDEQRRIAAILDQADTLSAKRKESVTALDNLVRAIFFHIFGERDQHGRAWPTHPLEDFCRPRQWPTISQKELTPSGYPVYGANGQIGWYSDYNHEHETVLITCRGATCGTINICQPRSYVTGNAMALDDVDESRVNLNYLAQALTPERLKPAITGSAQPQITRESLRGVLVPLPPLELQDRFSSAKIEISEHRQAALQEAELLARLFSSLQSRAFSGNL